MRVIKEGKWNNPWSAEFACSNMNCRAVLLVEEKDVKATYAAYGKFHFVCPVCGVEIGIPSSALPPRIVSNVERTRKYSARDWR